MIFSNLRHKKLIRWFIVIAYMLVIFMFSSQSGALSNRLSSGVSYGMKITREILSSGLSGLLTAFILLQQGYENENEVHPGSLENAKTEYKQAVHNHRLSTNELIRKLTHFGEYFILIALLYNALVLTISSSKRSLIISFFTCLIYAFLDEVHQLFVPGRRFLLTDVLIDLSGAVLFIVLVLCFRKKGYKVWPAWR